MSPFESAQSLSCCNLSIPLSQFALFSGVCFPNSFVILVRGVPHISNDAIANSIFLPKMSFAPSAGIPFSPPDWLKVQPEN